MLAFATLPTKATNHTGSNKKPEPAPEEIPTEARHPTTSSMDSVSSPTDTPKKPNSQRNPSLTTTRMNDVTSSEKQLTSSLTRKRSQTTPVRRSPSLALPEYHPSNIRWPSFGGDDDDEPHENEVCHKLGALKAEIVEPKVERGVGSGSEAKVDGVLKAADAGLGKGQAMASAVNDATAAASIAA